MPWYNEEENSKNGNTNGLWINLLILIIMFIFSQAGLFSLGLVIGLVICIKAVVIMNNWNLRKFIWFWSALTAMCVIEFFVLYAIISFSYIHLGRMALMGIGAPDFLINILIIGVLKYHLVEDTTSLDAEEDSIEK